MKKMLAGGAILLQVLGLVGCASLGMGGLQVRTDSYSGDTIVDSDKIGGFSTYGAKIDFSWNKQHPAGLLLGVSLVGIHNINAVNFNLNGKEIVLQTNNATSYGDQTAPSYNVFSMSDSQFKDLCNAMIAGEVKMLVTGPGNTYHVSKLVKQDYDGVIAPFIAKVNEIKNQ